MFKRSSLLVLLAVVLPLVLGACAGSPGSVGGASTTVSLNMVDFKFEPDQITVPAGKEITVNLSNTGAVEHDMTIMVKPANAPFDDEDKANVYWQKSLVAGDKATVTFTAPEAAGEYELVCSVPGHIEAGMVGKVVVVQP